ncbi:MAG: ATP-binding protein [Armatimonadota bacterium]
MRLRGLRAQLCAWHAGLMALTLVALAGLTYVLLIGVLHSRADAALREHADASARQIATRLYRLETQAAMTGRPFTPRAAEAGQPFFLTNELRSWGRYVQVVDPQGNVYERSDGLNSHPLPVTPDALRRGLQGLTTIETIPGLAEHPVRIVTVPVRMGERIPFLVQAGTSLEGVEAALQRAGWVLILLTPLVFLLALAGNWLVIGRTLRRVDDLTRTALDIQGSNLRRRIEHPGADDEIGRLARAFDQMIARLDRSFQQVRQFSADASHELKTPLTVIRGEAEVALRRPASPEEYQRSLRTILDSAERMSEVVESLLLLARADSGQALIRREPVELSSLTVATVEDVEPLARRQGVMVEFEEVDDVTISGDPLWLRQVLVNLVSNGIKYTPAGGTVTVSLRREDGTALLEVRDTGIGIPEAHLPHIFDRFYRVDEGRARTAGGAGLGLSITRWAVEAHDGEISVDSEAGRGSTFRVRLPAAPEAAADEEQLQPEPAVTR